MKHTYLLNLLLLSGLSISSQNLVPNFSFEDTVRCPVNWEDSASIKNWFNPTAGSPDFFHTCKSIVALPNTVIGYQKPFSGEGLASIIAFANYLGNDDYREYIGVKLLSTLDSGEVYNVSFMASLIDSSALGSSLGLYLGTYKIDSFPLLTSLNLIPTIESPSGNPITDTINWTKVSGTYIAKGNESYLYIGNFRNDSNSDTVRIQNTLSVVYNMAHYFIDDVVVIKGSNTSISSIENLNSLNVYPNPSHGILTLENSSNFNAEFVLYNTVGVQIQSFTIPAKERTTININKSGLFYLLDKNSDEKHLIIIL